MNSNKAFYFHVLVMTGINFILIYNKTTEYMGEQSRNKTTQ